MRACLEPTFEVPKIHLSLFSFWEQIYNQDKQLTSEKWCEIGCGLELGGRGFGWRMLIGLFEMTS